MSKNQNNVVAAAKNFLAIAVAAIKGDEAEVIALKIQKRANSILTTQVAMQNLELNKAEDALETAKEDFQAALINNGELIKNDEVYIMNLQKAQDAITMAELEIESIKETIAQLEEFQKRTK